MKMANYILNNEGYFIGTVDNDMIPHTKIEVEFPELTVTQRCKWNGTKWIISDDPEKMSYVANGWKRDRQAEYPSIAELVVALYDTDDKADIEAKRAAVKAKYPKPE